MILKLCTKFFKCNFEYLNYMDYFLLLSCCIYDNFNLVICFKEVSTDEAVEQAAHLRSRMYILWGILLYERSVGEFKMDLSAWEKSLAAAVETFELAVSSPTDLAVIIKNHCSNGTASAGLGFKIDEIVQAWNEMYEVKRWLTGVPSFRLEPLFRRRVSKLHSLMEVEHR
ncbi:protein PHOX1-like [Lactuca sativa]|uniref:Uncharacterized protein n=1 Tax=Lactuca sativa TaxID=4236 RepID=A0A9R1WF96_LACSA|nr:protein PHOX1-like [Lactuca sativa]KAJ0224150.1 hypothetical protein LSAT_V11C200068170 [Lactuca sativa]